MQNVSALYRQIASGNYITQSKIEMYDRPDKNTDFTLRAVLASDFPPSGGIRISIKTWEASRFGGQNGQFLFTRVNGVWYYDYSGTGRQQINSVELLGIFADSDDPLWDWHNADYIAVTRAEKVRPLLDTFYDDRIISLHPTWHVFTEDNPTIGGCYSAQNQIQLKLDDVTVPTMAEFRIFKRITNGVDTSEWLPNGIFYVDTREIDGDLHVGTFQCYDSMLKAEQTYREITGIRTWPISDLKCVENICSLIGLEFDDRGWETAFSAGSKVGYPNDKTMREVLSEIAVAHCGNFIITYEGKLRLIPLKGWLPTQYLNGKWDEFKSGIPFKPYRQVTIRYDEENAFSYPYPVIDQEIWESSVLGQNNGDFEFTVERVVENIPLWEYNGNLITIGKLGLAFIGTPAAGDRILVTRNQDISVKATRNQREDPVEVDLAVWDLSSLGEHNGSYVFTYMTDENYPENNGWYYGSMKVELSGYGISFASASENGDQIKVTRFNGERAKAEIESSSEDLTVSVSTDTWEDSTFGGVDGSFVFTYENVVSMTQQQSGSSVPVPLSGLSMDRWEDTFGETDGTYVLTYNLGEWKCTSGPDDPPEGPFVLSYIGLSFTGVPQNGDTITVIRNSFAHVWRYQNTTVNLVTLGISLVGSPALDDTLTVTRSMEIVDEIRGTSTTQNIQLEIDADAWESSSLGKADGVFKLTYSNTTEQWEYLSGELLIPVELSDVGISYELIPDHGDIITVERSSGLIALTAEIIPDGRVLQAECSFITQGMVEQIYKHIKDYIYYPYEIPNAILDPSLEPGDRINPAYSGDNNDWYILASMDIEQEHLYSGAIGAPSDEEVNHEYEYKSQVQKDLSKKVTLGQVYYGTSISREAGITIERSDGGSKAVFNSDQFTMQALIDGTMQDRVYFDPVKGDYVFAGALAADAVFTDSLYAEQGYVAELTVDQLTTSRRIREYLLDHYYRENPAYNEDNFIEIQGYHIRWATGSVKISEELEPLTEQAKNRNGNLLFWDGMVRSCTSEGYPLGENGNQLYSTEKDTGYPIMVYQYRELDKMQALFESDGTNYAPKLILGAGDENGNNVGYLYKATDGLHLDYKNRYGLIDSIMHYELEDFWRLNGIGIAPVDELPEEPLRDVIYLTPEED